jgi:hypothetical protein
VIFAASFLPEEPHALLYWLSFGYYGSNVVRQLEKLLREIFNNSGHPNLVLAGVSVMIAALVSIILRMSFGSVD